MTLTSGVWQSVYVYMRGHVCAGRQAVCMRSQMREHPVLGLVTPGARLSNPPKEAAGEDAPRRDPASGLDMMLLQICPHYTCSHTSTQLYACIMGHDLVLLSDSAPPTSKILNAPKPT